MGAKNHKVNTASEKYNSFKESCCSVDEGLLDDGDFYMMNYGFENSKDRNYLKNTKDLEEKKLEEKCKQEIEDIEKEKNKVIKEDKENDNKFEEKKENLLNKNRNKKYQIFKIFSLILFNLVLIFFCLVLFYFYFNHSDKKQKGSIECIYFYPGNQIDILNPNYNYDKDILQILINGKEINKNEKYKSNSTDSFNVTIKLFSDSIDLSDMFTSQNVKTVIMKSQSSIKIINMKNVFEIVHF